MRPDVQANVLRLRVALLRRDIERVTSRGERRGVVPLRDELKLHRTGAGDRIVREVDRRQGAEVRALPLVVALRPVAVGRTNPGRIRVVRGITVRVVRELAPVERQSLRSNAADDDAVERAAIKLQLAQLAPRGGVKLVVEAHDVFERDALKGNVRVGRNGQQEARADVVDRRIARHAAGDRAVDENDVQTVRAVVLLTQIAVRIVAVQNVAVFGLPRLVVSHTVAENAIRAVFVVANGDVHRAVQLRLRRNVIRTGHRAELFQRVGVGLSALGHASLILDLVNYSCLALRVNLLNR